MDAEDATLYVYGELLIGTKYRDKRGLIEPWYAFGATLIVSEAEVLQEVSSRLEASGYRVFRNSDTKDEGRKKFIVAVLEGIQNLLRLEIQCNKDLEGH